jgi:CheY-like chemotaxis protein
LEIRDAQVAGKLQLQVRPLTVPKVVTGALRAVHPNAEAKHLRLSFSTAGPRRIIAGDRKRLQQVAVAVLSHAIEGTPEHGSIAVTVSSHGAVVDVAITDNGPGMSDERLANVFEPFAWVHQPGGIRSGLALARHIVEAHGGTLTAQSDGAGNGSTFTIQLPVVTGQRGKSPKESQVPPRSEDVHPERLAGICALVVEDQSDSREFIETLLTRCHVRVVAVESVRQALDALDHHPIDVIISDVGLPEEDGLTLLNRVRARPPDKRGRVPAVALSACAGPTDRERAFEAGYQTFLAKPVEPSDVLAAVAALVCQA